MRSYKDISESIFRRRDEYLEKKRKRAIIIRRSVAAAASLMIVVFIGAGLFGNDSIRSAFRKSGSFSSAFLNSINSTLNCNKRGIVSAHCIYCNSY